jgi:hypothetical protein
MQQLSLFPHALRYNQQRSRLDKQTGILKYRFDVLDNSNDVICTVEAPSKKSVIDLLNTPTFSLSNIPESKIIYL